MSAAGRAVASLATLPLLAAEIGPVHGTSVIGGGLAPSDHPRGSLLSGPSAMPARLVILLLVLASPLAAQPWAGTAALGVEVSDRRGRPVSGAEVELAFLGDPDRGGPAPSRTDAQGRVEIRGLADGRWVLRIRHLDFLGYEADLELRSGRKPKEGSVARLKDGKSVESSRVRYFKVEGTPRPPRLRPAPPQPPPRPPPRPRAEPPAPTPPPPAPIPRLPPPPSPAPVTPPPAARPARPAAVVPATEPEPAPAPEPDPPPAAVPPIEPPSAPTPQLPPVPPAAARPPLPGPDPRFLRSPRDGTCFDCRPGEWATFVDGAEQAGGTDGTGCLGDLSGLAHRLAEAMDGGAELAGYAGPLLDAATGSPFGRLASSSAAALTAVLAEVSAGSRCRYLALWLPAAARFVGFQYQVTEGRRSHPCLPGQECPVRDGRFPAPPGVVTAAGGTLVIGGFDNRSSKVRQPRLTVYFVPSSRWEPAR